MSVCEQDSWRQVLKGDGHGGHIDLYAQTDVLKNGGSICQPARGFSISKPEVSVFASGYGTGNHAHGAGREAQGLR